MIYLCTISSSYEIDVEAFEEILNQIKIKLNYEVVNRTQH